MIDGEVVNIKKQILMVSMPIALQISTNKKGESQNG
jgi:hypothetical protein